jgi:hypothetical protein
MEQKENLDQRCVYTSDLSAATAFLAANLRQCKLGFMELEDVQNGVFTPKNRATTLSIWAFSITTLSINCLYVTLSLSETQLK